MRIRYLHTLEAYQVTRLSKRWSNSGIGCLIDPRNQGCQPKVEWLQKRFAEGLRFLLFRDEENKPLAFLEYVPGEYAYRQKLEITANNMDTS